MATNDNPGSAGKPDVQGKPDLAAKPDPGVPDVQGMIDDLVTGGRRQKRDTIGVCPTCGRTISSDNTGHAPECQYDQFPQEPPVPDE